MEFAYQKDTHFSFFHWLPFSHDCIFSGKILKTGQYMHNVIVVNKN